MNKKGSMELSVNSIVILVIAVVMMGLILGFIKTKFSDASQEIKEEEPEAPVASINNPISLSREDITTGTGKSVTLKSSVYNSEATNMTSASPTISCTHVGLLTSQTYDSKTIPVGNTESFIGILNIGSLAKDKYLCQMRISYKEPGSSTFKNTTYSKEFIIEIQ